MEPTVVYADVLVLLNFAVDVCLLLTVQRWFHLPLSRHRLLLGGVVGGLTSLTLFLPPCGPWIGTLIALLTAALIVWVTFGYGSHGRFWGLFACFFGLTFAYAGAMTALWALWRPHGLVVRGGVVYWNISPTVLLVTTAVSYGILRLIQRLSRPRALPQRLVELHIVWQERQIRLTALVDTGHSLRDILTDSPVVVCEDAAAASLLPDDCRDAVLQGRLQDLPPRRQICFRLLPLQTVEGTGLLTAFRADRVSVILSGDRRRELTGCLIALSPTRLGEEYQALVSPFLDGADSGKALENKRRDTRHAGTVSRLYEHGPLVAHAGDASATAAVGALYQRAGYPARSVIAGGRASAHRPAGGG